MIIIKAISKVFESGAKVIENTADLAVMATDYGKEAMVDESIKRDLEGAKSILDLKKELGLNTEELAEVQALREVRKGGGEA